MSIFDDIAGEAAKLMREAVEQTSGMKVGVMPSIPLMQGTQAELVEVYYRLGELLAQTFSEKELANLGRKVSAARAHLKGRNDLELTQEDARQRAIEVTEKEHQDEITKMSLYEHSRILRDSISKAIDHLTQTISTVKYLEPRPSTSNS